MTMARVSKWPPLPLGTLECDDGKGLCLCMHVCICMYVYVCVCMCVCVLWDILKGCQGLPPHHCDRSKGYFGLMRFQSLPMWGPCTLAKSPLGQYVFIYKYVPQCTPLGGPKWSRVCPSDLVVKKLSLQ